MSCDSPSRTSLRSSDPFVFPMDLEDDHPSDSEDDDIRYSYAARWNFSSRQSSSTSSSGLGRTFRPRIGLGGRNPDPAAGRREVPWKEAWLPLLPLPPPPRPQEDHPSWKRKQAHKVAEEELVGRNGEPLGIYRVRARDHRVVGHFLDEHLPEFDPGVSFPVLLNSSDCYAWVVQPTRQSEHSRTGSGWATERSGSIMEDLWNDTPPSTPPCEDRPLGGRLKAKDQQGEGPMDQRLPILGCLIVRVMHPRGNEDGPTSAPTSRTERPKVVCHFMALAVSPECRRLGLAETLVGMGMRKAGEVGAIKAGRGLRTYTLSSTALASASSVNTETSKSASAAFSASASASQYHPPLGYFDDIHHHNDTHLKHYTSTPHETLSISIALRAEGIMRRVKSTGDKDEGSMLFWKRMGLSTRLVRFRGRRGWEGDGVRDVRVEVYPA